MPYPGTAGISRLGADNLRLLLVTSRSPRTWTHSVFLKMDVQSRPRRYAVGHNRETRGEDSGPTPLLTSPDANPKQGGKRRGEVAIVRVGVELAHSVDPTGMSAVTAGGGGAHDD